MRDEQQNLNVKEEKRERRVQVICVAAFLVACTAAFVSLLVSFYMDYFSADARAQSAIEANAYVGSDYAFAEEALDDSADARLADADTDDGILRRIDTAWDTFIAKVDIAEEKVTNFSSNHSVYGKDFVVMVNRAMEKASGLSVDELLSGYVETSDGYLSAIYDEADISESLQKVVDFADDLEKQGVSFLFFEAPTKFDAEAYDGIYTDDSDREIAEMMETLRANGIPAVSMTEKMTERISVTGETKNSFFFKTDHHWLPQTAMWANSVLAEELNASYGFDIDTSFFDLDNYTVTLIPNSFLGSQGLKVSVAYAPKEDFPVLLPNYSSNLTVFNSYLNQTTTGTIEETLLDASRIYIDTMPWETEAQYKYYAYGDMALWQIHNNDISDGKRILLLKASMADCMLPYLSMAAEYVDAIDLRYFTGSLQTYIAETKPDVVVLLNDLNSFRDTNEAALDFR